MENNTFTVTLESEAFVDLKNDFNQVLIKTLANMRKKESEHAELTLKLTIDLVEGLAPDFENSTLKYRAERGIVKPIFSHKVSSLMKIKDEKSGIFSGDYELIWDDKEGSFIMRAINSGQMSLYDSKEQVGMRTFAIPEKCLPKPGCAICAAMDEDNNVTEADYKEILPQEAEE